MGAVLGKEYANKSNDKSKETEKECKDLSEIHPEVPVRKNFFFDALGARKKIGVNGGTIKVEECKVVIPPNALSEDVQIELTCCYKKAGTGTQFDLTLLLICRPPGLQFKKDVEITLPVLQNEIKTTDVYEVAIREANMKKRRLKIIGKDWLTLTTNSFTFTTSKFSSYRAVLTEKTEKQSKKGTKEYEDIKLTELPDQYNTALTGIAESKIEGKEANEDNKIEKLLHVLQVIPGSGNPLGFFLEKNELQLPINAVRETNHRMFNQFFNNKPKIKDASPSPRDQDSVYVSDDLCAKAKIGKGGGTFEVGGCKVIIPPNALLEEVEIEISVQHEEVDDVIRLTPLLRCQPHGLEFQKEIKIILSTCYRAEKDVLPVSVRRAKDESADFETIGNDLLCNETQHFKFKTDMFSLFDIILFKVKKKLRLLREKVLIFGLSPDTADAPKTISCSVLICHKKSKKNELNNMNKVLETNFFLDFEDQELDVQLKGEHLSDLTAKIENALCERDETPFTLEKNNGEGWINDSIQISLISRSGKKLVDKNLPITEKLRAPYQEPGDKELCQQPAVDNKFNNCNFESSTISASQSHHDGRST